MDLVFAVAVVLLLAGVVGSVVPAVPGAALSLAGIYLYWWQSGFTTPGALALVAFTLVGVAAMLADHLGGALAAKAGGASTKTMLLAGLVALPLTLVGGPVALVLGIAAVVFAVEFYLTEDARHGSRAAAYATVGVLGSAVVQLVVTLSLLAGFLLAVL